MKKILAILLAGIFVASIPAASSLMLPKIAMEKLSGKPVSTADVPEWADGNFSGVYALKNETGEFVILGNIFGHYSKGIGPWGNYAGEWETLDGNQSGGFSGMFFRHISFGHFNTTGSEDEYPLLAIFRVNESEMSINSLFIIPGDNGVDVRYAMLSYTVFE